MNFEAALKCIDDAIVSFPRDRKYALTVKFEIARLFHNFNEMERVIRELEADGSNENTIVVCNQVDKTIAKRIVEYRNLNGNYGCLEDLLNVKGVGKITFDKFKDYIIL